ncbi:MAG: NAD-dependent epimerase/dehydratase family protein [Epsilonproteobacteria bacterium]|nr:NAD-dependent epimerase/dehydratase family protein [Campylobacterota bacterium]OIO15356.1 MAG: sugar epimerase [Helicobacteraceae bacterium CG1_02_36_14]PIP10338.1 MAG: sugar epimerase [Sulfurimonas sp. CG23_combo_of_CG06-09_8_20_14_all_36_33]PIS25357.1 MAG: sugar epimerase [Sulfurimonas sp. CG08_land_8_20_14_0_20_36_33]PIU34531.1 MAG: sugar epimerase [Sulfurimonas sp. CG07_land_8_20_14_0_80_36_56]PIV02824.1 MAG: sugar epimerase [Sulfurimonas sp. CG03_land_8_20_14_0_80_36_25]PIV36078.1 MAG
MNIFITGASGFIGTHLKEYVQKKYNNYNLFTPSSKELDLADEKQVDNYILSNKIDIIIHLANRGGGRDVADMKNITEYNLRIFFNIAKHEKNVKKIISFGSGAEYGKHKPIVNAKEEDYFKEQPHDEYGFYKSITSKYIEKSDKIVQLRIFGAYGKYENYKFKFISNAIVKNLLKLPIIINKNVFFDYIYIDDLVKMIDWFIHNDSKEKIYNVTTGEKIDLISLVHLVNEISNFKSEIRVSNEGLNNEYTSNNDRLMNELKGFEFTSHKDAIIKMREYFSYNFDKLDKATIINDPYLKKIDNMWKKENK